MRVMTLVSCGKAWLGSLWISEGGALGCSPCFVVLSEWSNTLNHVRLSSLLSQSHCGYLWALMTETLAILLSFQNFHNPLGRRVRNSIDTWRILTTARFFWKNLQPYQTSVAYAITLSSWVFLSLLRSDYSPAATPYHGTNCSMPHTCTWSLSSLIQVTDMNTCERLIAATKVNIYDCVTRSDPSCVMWLHGTYQRTTTSCDRNADWLVLTF